MHFFIRQRDKKNPYLIVCICIEATISSSGDNSNLSGLDVYKWINEIIEIISGKKTKSITINIEWDKTALKIWTEQGLQTKKHLAITHDCSIIV